MYDFALIELKLEQRKNSGKLQSQQSGSTDSYVGEICTFSKTAEKIQSKSLTLKDEKRSSDK